MAFYEDKREHYGGALVLFKRNLSVAVPNAKTHRRANWYMRFEDWWTQRLLWLNGIVRLGLEKMRLMTLRKITILGLVLMLASCATAEFREEKGICTATWMKKIPPRYEREMYNQLQFRQVPTGQISCTTTGFGYSAYTNCTQLMRTEYYTVPAVRTVDRNKGRRDTKISACTQQKCTAKYGNVECKN